MAEEDIIFGKKRHMFGGIEPSNMKTFEAVEPSSEYGARFYAELPDDTVIDGQTLCSVAGAEIRRRYDRYPEDEFDGEHVITITEKGKYRYGDRTNDTSSTPYKTCFYAAFPYTTQGVYNRNIANRFAINDPGTLDSFRVISTKTEDMEYRIVVLGGFKSDANVGGVMIRRKAGSHPINENDGDLVGNVTYTEETASGFNIEDPNETEIGVDYYYSAFVYSASGVYSSDSTKATINIEKRAYWYYGYDLDTNDPTPNTRVSYPPDVDNAIIEPYADHVSPIDPWLDCGFMPRPCILKNSGIVREYLNPNDYTLNTSGEESLVADYRYEGNAMMEWPKIYTKRWEENGVYHFRCSNKKLDDDYDCWCNYDKDNNEIDHFYTAIYPGYVKYPDSITSNRLRSLSGVIVTHSKSPGQFMASATNNGDGWYVETLADRLLIQDLLVLIARDTNTSNCFGGYGKGRTTITGTLDKGGLFASGYNMVKVFGMEFWWGSFNRLLSGRVNRSGYTYVKITPGTHDGTTTTGYNKDSWYSSAYHKHLNTLPKCSKSTSEYIKYTMTFPYGRIPYVGESSGSSSTYECDMHSYRNVDFDRLVTVGGYNDDENALNAGAFNINGLDNDVPTAITHGCAALSYRANSTSHSGG